MRLRRVVLGLLVAAASGGGYAYLARGGGKAARPPAPPVPVGAIAVASESVANDVIGIATIEASASVAVKARIDGEIVAVNVREGDTVKANDLLFTLDQRTIDAQIRQAQANFARDQAQLDNARKELARTTDLANRGVAAQATLDKARAQVDELTAAVAADQAQLDNLTVQRSFTEIRAPIAGRLGAIALTAGNLVKANDTDPLVTINQIQPVRTMVPVAQRHFEDVRAALAKGPPPAFASLRDRPGTRAAGTASFLDNTIDPATGTFGVRALFPNQDGLLWPGMVVNVAIRLGIDEGALLVPTAAIQAGQRGPFVFVVKPDDTVETRDIQVVREVELRSVVAGVAAGERVVTDGQLRLTNGTKVAVRAPAGAAPSAAAPAPRRP